MKNEVYENVCKIHGHSIMAVHDVGAICIQCGMTLEEIQDLEETEKDQPRKISQELPEDTRYLFRGTIVKINGLPVRLEDPVLASSHNWNIIGNIGRSISSEKE